MIVNDDNFYKTIKMLKFVNSILTLKIHNNFQIIYDILIFTTIIDYIKLHYTLI